MTNQESRAKLARVAARLNAASAHAGQVPPLILLTDDDRLADPLAAADALPRGSMVIVRARQAKRRRDIAERLMARAAPAALHIVIAADPALATRCGAAGVHWPQARLPEAQHWRGLRPNWFITCAVHDSASLLKAQAYGADAALLSPVFATHSHPGAAELGPLRAAAIARAAGLPVYALGGITAARVQTLHGLGFCGLAAIGALAVEQDRACADQGG